MPRSAAPISLADANRSSGRLAIERSTTATLVDVNGWWGLVIASIPLGACVVVGALLLGPGGRAAQSLAAVVVALLGGLTVLSLLSIGLFLVPAVAGLGVAVMVALGSRPPGAASRPGPAR